MSPIVRCHRPVTLTPRETLRRCMSAGMTRAEAKLQYRRMDRLEWWGNEIYSCAVDRDSPLHNFGPGIRVEHISFHRRDQQPVVDWREGQAIKSAICGANAEGMSLYPAESRVVDTANEFHIFVPFVRQSGTPGVVPVGWGDGLRDAPDYEGSVQRPLQEAA